MGRSQFKILFFEELGLYSAVRKKLRLSRPRRFPPGFDPMEPERLERNFDFSWESTKMPWPQDWTKWSGSHQEKTLALSCGHLFSSIQVKKLNDAIHDFIKITEKGLWVIKEGGIENTQTGSFVDLGLEYSDLNSEIDKFDFSLFASQPRHFNQIEFDETNVTKTCLWKEKGLAEIEFLNSVPTELKSFYPSVIKSYSSERSVNYTMKNQRRFDLGLLSWEDALRGEDWQSFYLGLRDYFLKIPTQAATPIEVRDRLEDLFVKKLEQRFEEFRQTNNYAPLVKYFKKITGATFEERVNQLIAKLKTTIQEAKADKLFFSHGDLSFSNILYDIETKEICFVDPRGKSKADPCFRPIEYDLAKLAHSAIGNYEYICRGCAFDEENDPKLSEYFLKFLKDFSISFSSIRLYESSLFWSLLPLHIDVPSQLLQFMLAGERALMASY